MASRPVMLLGNLVSIIVTIAGILQALSWTIAGAMILAVLSITTLIPSRARPPSQGTSRSPMRKTSAHPISEMRTPREKTPDRPPSRTPQSASKLEAKFAVKDEPSRSSPSQSKSDFQKLVAPKIAPPKVIPATVSPAKPSPIKSPTLAQETLRPIPPQIRPTTASTVKPTPKIDPNVRIIERGDYATRDLQLEQGTAVTCEITASAPVNVYILDQENLTGLDLGEEFWSETGKEDVEKATVNFVAPENGKWFLVVENTENNQVTATLNVKKTSAKAGSLRTSG